MRWIWILGIILFSNSVVANMEISQIVYDGEGADEGKEFIEIQNTGNSTYDVSEYSMEYNSGTEWVNIWDGNCEYCFMKSNTFYIIGEINESDSKVNLNLLNTRGAFRLLKNNTQIDLVGFGDSTLFEGSPAIDVNSGKSLLRVDNTGNNFADFIESEILIRNIKENVVEIIIENSLPEVVNYSSTIVGDISMLQLEVIDLNGLEDLQSVEIKCEEEIINISYDESIGVDCSTDYEFRVWDSEGSSNWYNVVSNEIFEIVNIEGCSALPGSNCKINIEAKANLDIDITLKLKSIYKGKSEIIIGAEVIENFVEGNRKTIELNFQIPQNILAGSYKGEIELTISE